MKIKSTREDSEIENLHHDIKIAQITQGIFLIATNLIVIGAAIYACM